MAQGQAAARAAVAEAAVRLQASSKGEWLELDGELELDGGEVLRLRQLLDLARESRSRFVALGEGDFLALSDTLRQQLADLARAGAAAQAGGQRLSGVAALAWEASGHAWRWTAMPRGASAPRPGPRRRSRPSTFPPAWTPNCATTSSRATAG